LAALLFFLGGDFLTAAISWFPPAAER